MKDNIDPKWAWFWESKPIVALPFWEDVGKPRNYGYGLPALEFAETHPSWSFGPRGLGVKASGFSTGVPSTTSEAIRFNFDNPTSGSITSGSRQAGFVGATMFSDVEYSASNPNGDPSPQLAMYGDSTAYSAPYRDGIRIQYNLLASQWRIAWDRQNTYQLLYSPVGQPYEPQPGEYFSIGFHIESENNNGVMVLNGIEVDTRTNFLGSQDVGDSFSVGARGWWHDQLWPSPIYCAYWWIEDRGSTIPGTAELAQLHDDPWGPFRHYREELHTNVYPMQRNYSQRFTKKIPLKPSEWNIDRTQLRPEFADLDIMFAWEGSTSLIDRNSGTQAVLGTQYGQNQVVQEHFGDVLDFISDPNAYGTGVRWINGIDQDYLKSGGPITLEALIKVDMDAPNDGTAQNILAIGTDTNFPYDGSIWLYTRGSSVTPDGVIDIVAQRRTTASWQGISNGSVRIPKNQWVHVVVTISAFTGGPIKLYVNGILRTTESTSGGSGAINNANSNVIVSDHTGGEEFHGKIACTRVYRGVLDQSQIQMLSKDPWGPIRHYRDTQPVQILAPQLPSHLSVIVSSTVSGNSIVISPIPSNGSFMTIS